jgi:hypothetical protein
MVPVRPKPGPITASARDCFPCEHRHGGHQVVPVDRGPGRSVWPTHLMMQHAGRPRVSTSRPVAAAASVTDLVGYPSSDAIVARRLSTGPAAPAFVKAYGHNGYFTSLKAIVHFYNTRDVLPRCQPHDAGEGTTCWPAPESTANMNTKRVGRLGLSDSEEDALVSFMQTLTDGFMPVNRQ